MPYHSQFGSTCLFRSVCVSIHHNLTKCLSLRVTSCLLQLFLLLFNIRTLGCLKYFPVLITFSPLYSLLSFFLGIFVTKSLCFLLSKLIHNVVIFFFPQSWGHAQWYSGLTPGGTQGTVWEAQDQTQIGTCKANVPPGPNMLRLIMFMIYLKIQHSPRIQ